MPDFNSISHPIFSARWPRELVFMRLPKDQRLDRGVPNFDDILRRWNHFKEASIFDQKVGRRRRCRQETLGQPCILILSRDILRVFKATINEQMKRFEKQWTIFVPFQEYFVLMYSVTYNCKMVIGTVSAFLADVEQWNKIISSLFHAKVSKIRPQAV